MVKARGGDPAQRPTRKTATPKKTETTETQTSTHDPAATATAGGLEAKLAAKAAAEAAAKPQVEKKPTNGYVFEIHPLAEAYPHMAEEIYKPFKESLLKNGQNEPIVVIPHPTNDSVLQIIDGRHRYNALNELGLAIRWKAYEGPLDEDHLREFVESQNVHRRDLTQGQRAMSAAKLYSGTIGRPKKKVSHEETDFTEAVAEEIANRNGIGLSTFRKAVRVNRLAHQFPEFVENVFEGKIQLAPAYDMVADYEQTDTKLKTLNIQKADFKKVGEAPSAIGEILRRAKAVEKQRKREDRDANIADLSQALPEDEFQVVYLDPPWQFETRSDAGMDRSAENHYPTMDFKAIKEAKPALADKAIVFIWVTNPFLAHGLDLIDAWGLTYKSMFVWHKDKEGTGYWNRQNHETLLVATTEKGWPAPLPGDQLPSCMSLPRGKHSEKPSEYAEWIEKTYPTAKKLEMYCRTPREGWTAWGYEASGVSIVDQINGREDSDVDDGPEDEELVEDELREAEETATETVDENNNASQGAEDDDGFFDPSAVPAFLKNKDPLGAADDEEPPM